MMNDKGQNLVEYILIFVAVVTVLLFALAPQGFVTKAINRSIDMAINGVNAMAVNYQP